MEAETPYGKMFQMKNYNLSKSDIKIGRHTLLNEGVKLTMKNWYKWKEYRWDLWGKYKHIYPLHFKMQELAPENYH